MPQAIRYGFDLTDPHDALFVGSAFFTVAELPADDSGRVLVRSSGRNRVAGSSPPTSSSGSRATAAGSH
ncbi:hypothetical protein [Actinocatenispora sera]|uniref:hypothetical protein n=1 Tax=Actinocatenispora sera TaxID=390989 RepID=UPI0004C393AD|nr:hypothetical protein [Actinocatenispora sera]